MDECVTGKVIALLRKKRNLTQKQLAEKLGVTDKAVSRWENGYGLPDVALLPKIAEVFGITTDELLTGKRPQPSAPSAATLAPVASSEKTPQPLDEIPTDDVCGIYRLRLRQVTLNHFTIPAILAYMAVFILVLLYSPLQASLGGETYRFILPDWIRGIFDRAFRFDYFALKDEQRLENFMMTIAVVVDLALLPFCLYLIINTSRDCVYAGMKIYWIFFGIAAAGFLAEATCIPFANRIYGTERYAIPLGWYFVFALAIVQLIFAYAVSCNRKPRRKVTRFTALSLAMSLLLCASAFSGQYYTLPKKIKIYENYALDFPYDPNFASINHIRYIVSGSDNSLPDVFNIGTLFLNTNRTVHSVRVEEYRYTYKGGYERRGRDVHCVVKWRYRTAEGYGILLYLTGFDDMMKRLYPDKPVGELDFLEMTLDADGAKAHFSFDTFIPRGDFSGNAAENARLYGPFIDL